MTPRLGQRLYYRGRTRVVSGRVVHPDPVYRQGDELLTEKSWRGEDGPYVWLSMPFGSVLPIPLAIVHAVCPVEDVQYGTATTAPPQTWTPHDLNDEGSCLAHDDCP